MTSRMTVVPSENAELWLESLLGLDREAPIYHLAVMQLARRTSDRYRDLSERSRKETVTWLRDQQARRHLIQLVNKGGGLDIEEQGQVFGESLPKGLRLHDVG